MNGADVGPVERCRRALEDAGYAVEVSDELWAVRIVGRMHPLGVYVRVSGGRVRRASAWGSVWRCDADADDRGRVRLKVPLGATDVGLAKLALAMMDPGELIVESQVEPDTLKVLRDHVDGWVCDGGTYWARRGTLDDLLRHIVDMLTCEHARWCAVELAKRLSSRWRVRGIEDGVGDGFERR